MLRMRRTILRFGSSLFSSDFYIILFILYIAYFSPVRVFAQLKSTLCRLPGRLRLDLQFSISVV